MTEQFRTPPPRDSLLELARRLLNELPGLLSDRMELLSLELRRAGKSLATMVVLGLVAAILLVTAWTAFWIGFAATLMHFGLAWGWTVLIVLVLNLAGAAFALMKARALVGNLSLPATRRHLSVASVLGHDFPPTTPQPRHEQTVHRQVRSNGQ